jgi:hypothetical protein
MFRSIAITGLAGCLLAAGALAAPSALAARFGGVGGGVGAPHMAAPHIAPGAGAMHSPHAAFSHPGTRVYGWHGGPHHGHIHHRRGFGVIVGDYYDGGYGYYGGCEWLRVRAEETGSGYWWRRYEDCID